MKKWQPTQMDGFFLAAVLAVNFTFLSFNAFKTLNFLDMGPFIDGAWRVYRGQVPCRDFIVHTGPLHHHLNAFFFHIFGFGKNAFLAHLVIASSLMICCLYFSLKNKVPIIFSALTSLLAMTSFYWPGSHPWYNQTAHLWGLISIGFIAAFSPFSTDRRAFTVGSLCGLLGILSFFSKTNIGFAYISLLFFSFLFSAKRFRAIAGFVVGAVLGLVFVRLFVIPSFKLYLDQAIFVYAAGQLPRLHELVKPGVFLTNYYWMLALLVAANRVFALNKDAQLQVLFFGLWPLAIFSLYTSGVVIKAEVEPMAMFAGLGGLLIYRQIKDAPRFIQWFHKISFFIMGAAVLCMTFYYARLGYEIAFWAFPTPHAHKINGRIDAVGEYALKAKPFQGWRCNRPQGEALDQMVDFFKNVPKNQKLWVLTDMQMLYGLTGHESPKGITNGFAVGVVPHMGKQRNETKKIFIKEAPEWLVTHKNEAIYDVDKLVPYLDLADEIESNYFIAGKFGNYAVLRRKMAAIF